MNEFYLVRKNLTRNKLRLSLNVFAIFIAFVLFTALGALNNAFDVDANTATSNRLQVRNKVSFTQTLPVADVNKIRALDGVKLVSWANWFGGYYQDPKNFTMTFVVDPESYLAAYPELLLSEREKKAWLQDRQGIVVGEAIAKKYGWKVGDRIPLSSNIFSQKSGGNTWDCVVDGIVRPGNSHTNTNFVLMHHKYFFETQSYGGEWIGWIVVVTKDASLNDKVAHAIDAMFANSSAQTKTGTEAEAAKAFLEQLGNINFIISSVVTAAFFTILLIVGNSMMLSIRERTKEIAVLKTVGFQSTRVFRMILSESLMLSMIGGLLGTGLAVMILLAIPHTPLAQFVQNLSVNGKVWWKALAYMVGLGLITGILPAYRAYKLNTIDALSRG